MNIDVQNQLNVLKHRASVICKTCGCLVAKEVAVKGESVIEKVGSAFGVGYIDPKTHARLGELNGREVIREVYYCKAHAPKEKK